MDFIPQRFHFGWEWTVTISSREELQRKTNSLPGHGDVWYTDGSKSAEGVDYNCHKDGKGTCMSLGWYADVFQSEVMALLATQ